MVGTVGALRGGTARDCGGRASAMARGFRWLGDGVAVGARKRRVRVGGADGYECAARDVHRSKARAGGGRCGGLAIIARFAPVAQLDRVPGYEPGGRGFESCRARQFCIENQALAATAAGAFLFDGMNAGNARDRGRQRAPARRRSGVLLVRSARRGSRDQASQWRRPEHSGPSLLSWQLSVRWAPVGGDHAAA